MTFDQRVSELGLQLPPEPLLPPGVWIPFEWVRVVGERCVLSGHGALGLDGGPAGPFGRVPSEVSLEAAQESARLTVLAMLGALRGALGSLDRVRDWVTLNGFVNADAGYPQTTAVLNPASDLLLEVFGEHGRHARTAIGVAALPLNLPVIMSAEVIITP
ncbi:RidA family protein [Mycolicibacterium moriokaense]|uniref:Enamine deaminase RidA (YjgF/YER057c/UK114 family) n=1 Tax=Mycolicibacterium moriokaense TaxID=39691 RepID=A0A318HEP9_9MYCO|nr:RidA family protein [Mycolicibacterium moriokaense]PXX07627.1 enamine deaminase RidA (YjgF/YER057c/UK114 family) [Mycolicibacterium moriokaense]